MHTQTQATQAQKNGKSKSAEARNADASAGNTLAGKTVDRRYVLKREIAQGRAVALYEAQHAHTRATVALKLAERVTGKGKKVATSPVLDEARVLAQLRHPGAVTLFDAGICMELGAYAAMEMLRGRTLDAVLAARRKLDARDVVHLGRQLCDVLAFAHGRGIHHGAVCPAHVFVCRDERGHEVVKLTAFGDAEREPAGAAYIAPEPRAATEAGGVRADLYALAAVLYECLAGTAASPDESISRLRGLRPDAPAELCATIVRALSRNPDLRPQTAAAFARALSDATGITAGTSSLLEDDPRNSGDWLAADDVAMVADTDESGRLTMPPGTRVPGAAVPPQLPAEAPQRRRFARAPYITPVRIVTAADEAFEGRSGDVSEGGLQLIASRALAMGERVHLRFALPTTGAITTVPATVQWVREGHGRVAMGLQFLAVPPATHAAITEYVALMVPEGN